ncbi:MAG: S8 family serine peptidase [Armatimonadetes bacterium]|nr:S8 family serine peptidase [Armatimonadota bacterium]
MASPVKAPRSNRGGSSPRRGRAPARSGRTPAARRAPTAGRTSQPAGGAAGGAPAASASTRSAAPSEPRAGESVRLDSGRPSETSTSSGGRELQGALESTYDSASAEEKRPGWRQTREERQKADLERAERNNEIPGIRQGLAEQKDPEGRPIDGTGRKVGFIELNYDGERDRGDRHAQGVRDVIGGDEHGVAPGAETRGFSLRRGPDDHHDPNLFPHTEPGFGLQLPGSEKYEDNATHLNSLIDTASTGLLDRATERLAAIHGSKAGFDALNLSLSGAPSGLYTQTDSLLNEGPIRNDDGSKIYDYPAMRRAVLGDDSASLTREQQWQKVVDYVDGRLGNPKGQFQQSLGRYQDVVKKLTESGTSVVAAAGNDGTDLARYPSNPPGATLNFLTRSPYVLTVGASDSRDTPGRRSDDLIAHWSSRGDGRVGGHNPTVAAPGNSVIANGEATSGTSFASPYVAGTIALMRQANPNLSTAQVRDILTSTAADTAGAGREAEGAGIVDPVAAVAAARRAGLPEEIPPAPEIP